MIAPTIDRIADRVRKLLALTKSGNEHEAAQAASRAAALMAQHNLVEAELAVTEGGTYTPEPIARAVPLVERPEDRTSKRSAWRETLAHAAANSLGVRMYYRARHPHGCGRESATQTWRYLTTFLCAEVDRLTEAAREAERAMGRTVSRAWCNAFRFGCAQRIAARLDQQTASDRANRNATVKAAVAGLHSGGPVVVSALALVRVASAEEEVDTTYATMARGWRTASTVGSVSSGSGLMAGRAAGDRANLGGTARAGLPAGQGRLR